MGTKFEETVESFISRIDERVKNITELIENHIIDNKEDYRKIISGQKELCEHVNHENEKMDARLLILEEDKKIKENQKEYQLKIYKCLIAILGTISTILGIGRLLGYI